MDIYDNGYLTEDEKSVISVQDLIHLAVSNYTGNPVDEILPQNIYEYKREDGKIRRARYINPTAGPDSDILWDDFVNARNPKKGFKPLFRKYRKVEVMDDDGNRTMLAPDKTEDVVLQLDFVGRDKPYAYIQSTEPDTAYFLTWVDDGTFLDSLRKFT